MSDRTKKAEPENRDLRALTAEKREALRLVIIDLFSQALFHDVGLREICARAGVTPRTVYRHFGAKDDLLLAAITPDLERLSDSVEKAIEINGNFEDRGLAAIRAYTSFYLGNIPVARIVFLNIPAAYFVAAPRFVQERQLGALHNLFEEGRKAGVVRNDAPVEDQVEACAAIAMRAMHRVLMTEESAIDPETVTRRIWRMARPMLLVDA